MWPFVDPHSLYPFFPLSSLPMLHNTEPGLCSVWAITWWSVTLLWKLSSTYFPCAGHFQDWASFHSTTHCSYETPGILNAPRQAKIPNRWQPYTIQKVIGYSHPHLAVAWEHHNSHIPGKMRFSWSIIQRYWTKKLKIWLPLAKNQAPESF